MLRAFLYDAKGKDSETSLDDGMPHIAEHQLLWIDVEGRDEEELRHIAAILSLDNRVLQDIAVSDRSLTLKNYGDYIQFDVSAFPRIRDPKSHLPKLPKPTKLDFVVTAQCLVTIHDEAIDFLGRFREQDQGETLIGKLSPASLAASLLDRHLSTFLVAVESLEVFVDALDVRMLASNSVREALLDQVVKGRKFVSTLRRVLGSQRSIFYGLARPDFSFISESTAAAHFDILERRFERVLDTVEHSRELMQGSFELFATRVNETTNVLIRRLTFLSLMLGMVGAAAGIFGMNFDTPYTSSGVFGFWLVVSVLATIIALSAAVSFWRRWI